MDKVAIILFRRDLRINSNRALSSIINEKYKIIPVYIHDGENEKYPLGNASKIWLGHALRSLNESVCKNLHVLSGNTVEVLNYISNIAKIDKIVANAVNNPTFYEIDRQIADWCRARDIDFCSFNDDLLIEPGKLLKNDGNSYKVFTPFYKKFYEDLYLDRFEGDNFLLSSDNFYRIDIERYCFSLDLFGASSSRTSHWDISEAGATNIFNDFKKNRVLNYSEKRDFPCLSGTSKLAPYLHFGQVSVKQVWRELQNKIDAKPFLRQLAWRDFAYYTLQNNNEMHLRCINRSYENFSWYLDEKLFEAWQLCKTGIPIIDAGMAELHQTGYMHNRVRMIVASFLTKNCNIDWRYGQEHFWENLYDADWANNSFGWQWVAGCGCDAAPYYRIFNPVLQSQKFDPRGEYIKKHLPEFSKLPSAYVHTPWLLSKRELLTLGLSEHYSSPIVDLSLSRKDALDRHAQFFAR